MSIFDADKVSDRELVTFVRDEIERKKRARINAEKQWMINANFYVGNHYLRYNRAKGLIEAYRPSDYDISINLVKAKHKAMKSALISDEPTFTTTPEDWTDESAQRATVRNRWLEKQWQDMEGIKYATEAVHVALLQSRAITWIDYDSDQLCMSTEDAFDTFVDTFPVQKGMYVIRTGRVDKEDLKNRKELNDEGELVPAYKIPRTGLTNDEPGHESQYKNQLQNMTKGAVEADGKVKVAEIYYKRYDEKNNKYRVYVATINGTHLLRNKDTGYSFFPCAALGFDIEPGDTEGYGWAKDVVEVNRQINRTARNKAQYHDMAAKYRMVTDSAKVPNVLTNESGQVIRITPGAMVQQMPMQSYPASADSEMNFLLDRIEDLSVRDITTGRTPSGVTAAAAFDSLIAADARNNSTFRSAYKEYIKDLGEIVLKMTAANLKTVQSFNAKDGEEMVQYQITGENPIKLGDSEMANVVPILSDTQVMVTIGSDLGNTTRGRQETVLNLFDRQVVTNPQFVLKQFGIDAEEARMEQPQAGGQFGIEDIKQKQQEILAQGGDPENDPEVQQMLAALERSQQNPEAA